jgi:16S rRNA (adenine1518-N6/adenine1519-N6)-dimethyltransferase
MPSKPKIGQHFLSDPQAAENVVRALGPVANRTVVEIGPGRGALTEVLAARAGHLLAVELDPGLAAELSSQFPPGRVTVVAEDVLRFDFSAAAAEAGERLLVIGNLPYYITSPILLKLAVNHSALDRAALMVQREVADRLAAAPGSRDYGLLSVTVQCYGAMDLLFTLPPTAFSPPPKVHSTVVRWQFAPRFAELGVEEHAFLAFARKAFAQKRKTLANNLRAAGFDAAAAAAAFAGAGVDPRSRAESLSIETLAMLHRTLRPESAQPETAAPAPESKR